MGRRYDYEHLERDNDGCYYWFMNADINYPEKNEELQGFCKWWRNYKAEKGLYYKGTRLYFTYKGVKYYVSWVFYDEKYLRLAKRKLIELGATNIQFNYGELD